MKPNFLIYPPTRAPTAKSYHYSLSSDNPLAVELAFTSEECDRVIKIWDDSVAKQARTHGDGHDESAPVDLKRRSSRTQWLSYGTETAWIFEKLCRVVGDANKSFLFDLSGFFEDIQLTRYDGESGGHYDWHEDVGGGDMSVRKLSMVVQLSDPESYKGGDLELHGEGAATRERGSVIVFPSFVTHRVKPMEEGTRFSMVIWVSGPPFR